MSNLLAIPFKKTYPVNIKEAARNYIHKHGGAHPDEFKEDINRWQTLRNNGVANVVHIDRVQPALAYHAQLVSILTKLPTDIQLDIAYAPVFSPSSIPVTLKNLAFERTAVLFNVAALYSQLGVSEGRKETEEIKRALAHFQYAAGTFSYLISSALPKLVFSPDDEEIPLDLSEAFIKSLEYFMLAQAQECSWQAAVKDNYKNGVIARVAASAASLYRSALTTIREASPPIKHSFPSDWLSHIEAKEHHFESVSQYRKSLDELEASRYGFEIARLIQAQVHVEKAYDVARRGKVAALVLRDTNSLLDNVKESLKRANKDNDNIYLNQIPAASALPPILHATLVKPTYPAGLVNSNTIVAPEETIFGNLMGWGAREALNIYNHRKNDLVTEKIRNIAQELKDQAEEALRSVNLPSALEALERPVGLPPSLLKKAEEVRIENGPAKIEASIEDVQKLAHHDLGILNEAMDILDNEASEDEAARKDMSLSRLPSHEANVELIEKERRYREILTQADASDEIIRQKWDNWENSIAELTLSEEELEALVPSSTMSPATHLTTQGTQTQVHSRALRKLLESLDSLHQDRDDLVKRTQALADRDDIRSHILKVASGFERLAEVEPAMFEDLSDEELSKYDKFLKELADIGQQQATILTNIKSRNELFLQSRRDDPVVKDREHALQSLDLAYHKYREIVRNLDEGFKFYNDLAGIFIQFKEACKNWSLQRNQEIHSLSRTMQSMSLRDADDNKPKKVHHPPTRPSAIDAPRKQSAGKSSLGLPAITSDDWGFEEMPLPPGPEHRK